MSPRHFIGAAVAVAVATFGLCTPANAGCRIPDTKLEQAIAAKSEFREGANAQVVRDLRIL